MMENIKAHKRVYIILAVLVIIAGLAAYSYASAPMPGTPAYVSKHYGAAGLKILKEEAAARQSASFELRASVENHMRAVRSGTKNRPNKELGQALVYMAHAQGSMFEDPDYGTSTMKALADMRTAMDDLRPLDGPVINCTHGQDRTPECRAYFAAVANLYAQDII